MIDEPTFIEKHRHRGNAGLRIAGALILASAIVVTGSGAISMSAAQAVIDARTEAATAITLSHTQASASARQHTADARLAGAVAEAEDEVTRASGVLDSSAGKAAEDGRAALSASIAEVTELSATGSAYTLTASVMSLREHEKAVTDSVAAFEQAEQARLAAEAAAAAAATAAAEYQNSSGSAAPSGSWSGPSNSGPSESGGSNSAPAPAAPYYAPGVPHERPSNDGCGPCDGATLVLTPEGYWGCPL